MYKGQLNEALSLTLKKNNSDKWIQRKRLSNFSKPARNSNLKLESERISIRLLWQAKQTAACRVHPLLAPEASPCVSVKQSSASVLYLFSSGWFHLKSQYKLQYSVTPQLLLASKLLFLCFLAWVLQRAFDGLKSKKLLIMLKSIYHFSTVIAALAHSFQRFALRITGKTQFHWNKLLQIHSQYLLHFVWPYDFMFQPVFRYLNIFDNCTQKTRKYFLNHWLFVTSHPPIPNSSLLGQILSVWVPFGGACAYSFHTKKQNEIHVPCDISKDSLNLLLSCTFYFARESYSGSLFLKDWEQKNYQT